MKVIGDYAQAALFQQCFGNGFSGGANIDEHGRVVWYVLHEGLCNPFLGVQIHDFTVLVGGIHRA